MHFAKRKKLDPEDYILGWYEECLRCRNIIVVVDIQVYASVKTHRTMHHKGWINCISIFKTQPRRGVGVERWGEEMECRL